MPRLETAIVADAGAQLCPPLSTQTTVESWSFDDFSSVLDLPDTFIHPAASASAFDYSRHSGGDSHIGSFGSSKDGCGIGMAVEKYEDVASLGLSASWTEWKSDGTN